MPATTFAVMAGYRTSARRISSALQGRRSSESVASKQTAPALTVSMCATRCGVGPQPVVVRSAERVVDFREDHLQPIAGVEAVEERDGVEAVAEIPQVRQ